MLREVAIQRHARDEREPGLDDRLLAEKHPAHVGVLNDRDRRALLRAERPALLALARVGMRLVVRARRGRDAVEADHDARLVHHLEHVANALVRLADEPAAAITALAYG